MENDILHRWYGDLHLISLSLPTYPEPSTPLCREDSEGGGQSYRVVLLPGFIRGPTNSSRVSIGSLPDIWNFGPTPSLSLWVYVVPDFRFSESKRSFTTTPVHRYLLTPIVPTDGCSSPGYTGSGSTVRLGILHLRWIPTPSTPSPYTFTSTNLNFTGHKNGVPCTSSKTVIRLNHVFCLQLNVFSFLSIIAIIKRVNLVHWTFNS